MKFLIKTVRVKTDVQIIEAFSEEDARRMAWLLKGKSIKSEIDKVDIQLFVPGRKIQDRSKRGGGVMVTIVDIRPNILIVRDEDGFQRQISVHDAHIPN